MCICYHGQTIKLVWSRNEHATRARRHYTIRKGLSPVIAGFIYLKLKKLTWKLRAVVLFTVFGLVPFSFVFDKLIYIIISALCLTFYTPDLFYLFHNKR